MGATWLDGLGARCSCIGAALVLPLSITRKETVFCDRQYHSCSLWLQSLWLSILLPHVYGTYLPPARQGPGLQHLADVRSIPYVMYYVNFTTSMLAYTLHSKANPQTLCSGTLTMYTDIPICLSSVSDCILTKTGNHLQTNGNTLKDSGLPFLLHGTDSKHSSQAKENHYLTLKIFIVFSEPR